MRKQDKIALERYQKKLDFAQSVGGVNPFESDQEKKKRIERAKKDVKFFVEYYFPHYATSECADFHVKYANRVKKDKRFTGFCEWGRGLAKSVWNTLIIPAWLWINEEPMYYLVVGSSYNRATQLLDDIRAEFEANPRIINDFGEQHNAGNWEEGFFVTKGGFIGQALGMGQSVRGLRYKNLRPTLINPDDIQIKELLNNLARTLNFVKWIEQDLLPCMDGEYTRFSYSNTRHADPKKMIQGILQEKHPKWYISHVKAYDPVTHEPAWKSKYTADYYRELEIKIGKLAALAEYCHIAHTEGSIFKKEHIQWGKMPRLNHFDVICGYWDVAYSGSANSDFNAIPLQGLYKNRYFWEIDTFVKQCKMRDAIRWMCQWEKDKPMSVIIHWLFEAQFWNDEVERTLQEVQQEQGIILPISKVITPKIKKYDRMLSGLHPTFQNGRFWYNEKNKSHNDTQVGISQLFGIEPGYKGHDDYPDAKERGKNFLEKHIQIGGQTSGFSFGKMKSQNTW